MSELGKLSKDGSDRFLESLKEAANDPKWEEKRQERQREIEKRQQQEKEERIQRKLDKLIKEELSEISKDHYEELRRKAISSVQIDEEERIQRKINESQQGQTLTLRELYGEEYEEEMERMRASEAIIVRLEIAAEERQLKLKEEKQKRAEERELKFEKERQRIEEICKIGETQKIEKRRQLEEEIQEQVRKIGENPNKPLTMKDLYLICPGFDQETLQHACNDLNLEMAKRIAREAYPNKFRRV